MGDNQNTYWIACSMVPGLGPVRFRRLLDHFRTADQIWSANSVDLRKAGLDARVVDAFISTRASLSLEQTSARLEASGARALTWLDADYPQLLLDTYAPPPVLYVRGTLTSIDRASIAVVGTRMASTYGKQVTERLVADLTSNGLTIVSGLARGIDTHAHQTALQHQGRTIAVLGTGVDIIYPPENAKLTQRIVERGAVVSEYPIGTDPEATNFPARNRIIAGMTLGTLVIEAGVRSGALITAGMALDLGREVFAVPGSLFNRHSEGTNALIQQSGAKLVTSAADVLEELNVAVVTQQLDMKELIPENDTERLLLQQLSSDPIHVDEIAKSVGMPVKSISGELVLMELKGLVRGAGGMMYVRAR